MTVGLIVNPKSGKESGHGLKLAELLADSDTIKVGILDRFEKLTGFMSDFANAGISTLFISSGDGTIQAIQTDIAETGRFKTAPALCLLPHGTTNMTAADLGFRNKSVPAQADFMKQLAAGETPQDTVTRATVRVANPADGQVRHGMFVGTGAAWQGTLYCQTDVHKTGLKGDWATFATLATALAKAAFLPANPDDKTRIDRPFDIAVHKDDVPHTDGEQLLLLATTLKKLILGVNPFWGGASDDVRMTTIAYPPPNIFRWTLPLLRGGEDRKLPDGCRSFSGREFAIKTPCPFVIDGEFFDPPADEPLKLEKGPDFTYVRG